ncbi:MAG: hypothetical protein D6772_13255, partial [Bacteroidetes bacterium]
MPKFFTLLSFLLLSTTLLAQLPKSNIYLFQIEKQNDTVYTFSDPHYLTAFNPNGYNNQPSFFSADELYISSQLPAEKQPEIYLLNLKDRTKIRVTETEEGEFSPRRMPDYYNFSAIRQEFLNRDTVLRLWQFPLDRLTNGRPVFKYLTGIGYYEWINSKEVAVFIVDRPNYLALANVDTDDLIPVATNVGRCMSKLPNGNLAFVQKTSFGAWKIKEFSLYSRGRIAPQDIIPTIPGAEDFAVLPDGSFLMGKGSKLYKFNRFRDDDW